MSSFDTWRLTLPNGDVFESSKIAQINEQHTPGWVFDGAGNLVAAAEQITGSSGSLKGQIYLGTGAGARIWRCTITMSQGQTDTWGSSNNDDDVTQKIQELGDALATTRIDSTVPATFEWGEYSSAGSKSAKDVVVGEVDLPAELRDQPSSFTFTVDLLETKDLTEALHPSGSGGDFELTPQGSSTPVVRIYTDSLDSILRAQTQQTVNHAVIEGGSPASDNDGLEPGQIRIRGYWFGDDASTLASRLRDDIINDPSVTTVDLQAIDDAGNDVASDYNGTYRLTEDLTVRQISPVTATAWEYDLKLTEI